MGPSILFDKSAIQSFRQEAIKEISRYFYTTIPPVLLLETLADLSLYPNDLETAKAKVTAWASKLLPTDSISNCHYHTMCVHNLLGDYVPMDRRPAVGRARSVATKDGTQGVFIEIQPEDEAVLRWQNGQFNQDDLKFAFQWREKASGANLEETVKLFPKPPFRLWSLEQVGKFIELIMCEPGLQEQMVHVLLRMLQCDESTCNQVMSRWRFAIHRSLRRFAPYAAHCLRVQLAFYLGVTHGFLGTRSSNIVDVEYLHYTPFAFIFCSGDKLHKQLAPLILGSDQSFVGGQEMREALTSIAVKRANAPESEPGDDSLIWRLWQKHWGKPPRRAIHRSISDEESKRIMEQIKPIIEALEEEHRKRTSSPRFPV